MYQAGQPEGSCASGFGVCCVMRLVTCGGVVTTNTTQLQNPRYLHRYLQYLLSSEYLLLNIYHK